MSRDRIIVYRVNTPLRVIYMTQQTALLHHATTRLEPTNPIRVLACCATSVRVNRPQMSRSPKHEDGYGERPAESAIDSWMRSCLTSDPRHTSFQTPGCAYRVTSSSRGQCYDH
jgi:hypothetical protein